MRVEPNSIPRMAFPASMVCFAVIVLFLFRDFRDCKITIFFANSQTNSLKPSGNKTPCLFINYELSIVNYPALLHLKRIQSHYPLFLHEIRFYLVEIRAYLNEIGAKGADFREILNDF